MAAPDCYRILGIKPSSTLEEVRRRYRLLARQHHPDLNPDDPDAAARFRQVAEAFEAVLAAKAEAKAKAKASSRTRTNTSQYRQPRFTGKEDFFEEFFGIYQDGSPPSWSAGADFRYDLEIPFMAAIKGMGTVISVDHHPPCRYCQGTGLTPGTAFRECPECQGRGRRFGGPGLLRFGPVCGHCQGRGKVVAHPCLHCGGLGSSSHTREYHLQIPPGTRDGTRLRIKGEGGGGLQNGPPGNLEVVIHVAPHNFFTRMGNDIHCRVEVSFAEAALGSAIRIPTLDGFQTVNLPQGTQSGWTFRFVGAGAPGGPQEPPGDQVNEVIVTTPQNLSSRQRSLLEELGSLEREALDRAGHE
ncbi:MAG: DnaJ C-terminal domain-containing protein [Thermodesulfobacteriota bacterium]